MGLSLKLIKDNFRKSQIIAYFQLTWGEGEGLKAMGFRFLLIIKEEFTKPIEMFFFYGGGYDWVIYPNIFCVELKLLASE